MEIAQNRGIAENFVDFRANFGIIKGSKNDDEDSSRLWKGTAKPG